eukprot:39276-Pleurochrysis_carterae.AAC.1
MLIIRPAVKTSALLVARTRVVHARSQDARATDALAPCVRTRMHERANSHDARLRDNSTVIGSRYFGFRRSFASFDRFVAAWVSAAAHFSSLTTLSLRGVIHTRALALAVLGEHFKRSLASRFRLASQKPTRSRWRM